MKLDITIMWTIYLRGADAPSLDAQEALCRQAAAELGYTTDPAHICRDDASGADMDRPVLQEMLNEAEAGAIHALVAPSWDRLSRDARDLVTILARLDRAGVQVHVADCLPEDLTKEVNLEETDAIRKILEMAAEGMTSGEIARKLKQEGILTYTRGKWRGSHVSRILDTIAMPVIEQALFKEVQGKLEASRRESEHRNSPHLLSGLVRCGRSGRPMWRMKTRKGVHYYRCKRDQLQLRSRPP